MPIVEILTGEQKEAYVDRKAWCTFDLQQFDEEPESTPTDVARRTQGGKINLKIEKSLVERSKVWLILFLLEGILCTLESRPTWIHVI